MRRQACRILGVSEFATEEEIKAAYKNLVKQYHPDTGNTTNLEYYNNVVQAYQYLKANPQPVPARPGRVMGKATSSSYYSGYSYTAAREYVQFEKGYQKQKEEKRARVEQRLKEEKNQREYDRAMEAIKAIRMAETLKAMLSK